MPDHSVSRQVRVTLSGFRPEDNKKKQIICAPLACADTWSFPNSPLPGRGHRRQGCSHSQNPHWAVVVVTGWLGTAHRGLSVSLMDTGAAHTHKQLWLQPIHQQFSPSLASIRMSKSTYIFQEEEVESQVLQTGLKDTATKAPIHFPDKDISDTWELPAPRKAYWEITQTELGRRMHLAFQV